MILWVALTTLGARAARPGPYLDEIGPGELDASEPTPDGLEDTGLPGQECAMLSLPDGVQLPESPELYTIWNRSNAWGTPRMVDTLEQVAEEMAWRFPHADPFVVGDLSRRGGGWMRGHRSHRGGLDADLGIYTQGAHQHQGGLRTVPASQMDLDANLAFVLALFDTGNVERILLDWRLIRALRRHAIDSGAMTEAEARAIFLLPGDSLGTSPWNLEGVVHHVPGHHHHFHVRVYCGD